MAQFDWVVGELLDKLDKLGIADNTIVIVSTDNGAEVMSWPDGGNTPFLGEKGTTWEGRMRVPQVVRWPSVIKPGTVVNDIMSHEDWLPTFLAAAGDPKIKEKLKKGHKAAGKTFKTHLDGYNFLPFFKVMLKRVHAGKFFTLTTMPALMLSGLTIGRSISKYRKVTCKILSCEP